MGRLLISHRPAAAPPGGACVVWDEARPSESEGLTAEGDKDASARAVTWAQRWTEGTLGDGRSFREMASWKGLSLGYFAEIVLHEATDAPRYVRVIERLHRILTERRPDEVAASGLPADVTILLFRLCRGRGIFFDGRVPGHRLRRLRTVARISIAARLRSLRAIGGGPKGATRCAAGTRKVVFFSPAGMGALGDEDDCERVLQHLAAGDSLKPMRMPLGGSGFAATKAGLEAWRARRYCRRLWRSLRNTPGFHESFSHREISFADLAAADFARMLLHELPEMLAVYESALATLDRLRPAAVCLRNQAGAPSRAVAAAAAARGVPCMVIPGDLRYSRPCVLERTREGVPRFIEARLRSHKAEEDLVSGTAELIEEMVEVSALSSAAARGSL